MRPELIERAACLDIEGWLNLSVSDAEHSFAREIHTSLLHIARSGTSDVRPALISRINQHADVAIATALESLSVLESRKSMYCLPVPSVGDEPDGELVGSFRDVYFVGALQALRAVSALRGHAPAIQLRALRRHLAEMERSESIAADGMSPLAAKWLAEDRQATRSTELPVGDKANVGTNLRSSEDIERHLSRLARSRLRAAERAIKALAPFNHAQELQQTCFCICGALQAIGYGNDPLPISLPSNLAAHDCGIVSRGYDNLAKCLSFDPNVRALGSRKRQIITALKSLDRVRAGCRALAAWIRALAPLAASTRCELCYRHRATRKRCATHAVKEYVTKEARLAAAIHPRFVQAYATLARSIEIRPILDQPLKVTSDSRTAAEDEGRRYGVPEPILTATCTLVCQLRLLRPLMSDIQAEEVEHLFGRMLEAARSACAPMRAQTRRDTSNTSRALDEAQALMTLRSFLILWNASGRPFPYSFPSVVGEGKDPAHPVITGSPMIDAEVSRDFLRQRAWHDAEATHAAATRIDAESVILLRQQGLSLDAIAAQFGCSHDTIAKLLSGDRRLRVRARLKGYSARSRIRSS